MICILLYKIKASVLLHCFYYVLAVKFLGTYLCFIIVVPPLPPSLIIKMVITLFYLLLSAQSISSSDHIRSDIPCREG